MAATSEVERETSAAALDEGSQASAERARERPRGLKRGLVLGLVTGLIGGTLLAPQPGEALRRRAREEAEELLAHSGALPERLRQRLGSHERTTEAEAAASGPAERLRSLVGAVRDRVREAIEQGRQASREAQERLRDEYRRMIRRG